jgi:hypothetical protein
MTCITRFKLLLNNDPSVPPLPNGLNVLDVIRDYLKGFHDYICTYMQKTRGARLYDQKRFRYCLTVPAMWNDEAKCIMREAAIRAGIIEATDHPDRLMLTSEPEAAALYCQKHCVEEEIVDLPFWITILRLICVLNSGPISTWIILSWRKWSKLLSRALR